MPRIMSSDLESCTDITIKVVFNLTLADIRISSKDLRKEEVTWTLKKPLYGLDHACLQF